MPLFLALGLRAVLAYLPLAFLIADLQSVLIPAETCQIASAETPEAARSEVRTRGSEEGTFLQTARTVGMDHAETTADFGWGPLSHRFCEWAFAEKPHVFHGMWSDTGAVTPALNALSNGQYKQQCWESWQMNVSQYMEAVRRQSVNGQSCIRNWNDPNVAPVINGSAMILGNDEDTVPKCNGWIGCSSLNMVRLTLGGQGMFRWNMCRNFEFVACGAMGGLPGQISSLIYLATAPTDIWPDNITIKSQENWTAGAEAYESEYMVTLLEMCLLDKMCSNDDELFNVKKGSYFQCEFDEQGFQSLKLLLDV